MTDYIIETQNITKKFNGFTAVDGLSLQINRGEVFGFRSHCGGLPAPEANTNPWGYKFSWSPMGVVLAGRNDARYLKGGEKVEVPGNQLFSHYTIFSINTSFLYIFNILDVENPDLLVITHLFSPATIIPLVEVVPGEKTSH